MEIHDTNAQENLTIIISQMIYHYLIIIYF